MVGAAWVRVLSCGDARVAADRVAAIAALANAQDHHPDLWWRGDAIGLTLTTHDVGGGITARDVAFAAEINARFPPG